MAEKPTAYGWLFILGLLIILIGLVMPDADAPVEHDYGEFEEAPATIAASEPKSTPIITQTTEAAEAESEDILPESDEPEQIVEALYAEGYFREDVPLDYVLQDLLHVVCQQYGVPYELGLGLIYTESGFHVDAVSKSGAQGLCQLMPQFFGYNLTPAENINAGMKFLGELHEKYGDWSKALTVYNTGHLTSSRAYANRVITNAIGWGWNP